MTRGFIVSGTDTGIGKTVFAAALTAALNGVYWKPVQSGTAEGTDRQRVAALMAGSGASVWPEAYCLSQPLSPHRSAELDGVTIDLARLTLPDTDRPLVVEGAGGLMVPLTRQRLYVDQFAEWKLPVVLCARTGLGTINHTLLSVAALAARRLPLLGIAFIGDDMPDTLKTIADFSGARILGRLPFLPALVPESLQAAFRRHFRLGDFA